jgi:hypothetical protein
VRVYLSLCYDQISWRMVFSSSNLRFSLHSISSLNETMSFFLHQLIESSSSPEEFVSHVLQETHYVVNPKHSASLQEYVIRDVGVLLRMVNPSERDKFGDMIDHIGADRVYDDFIEKYFDSSIEDKEVQEGFDRWAKHDFNLDRVDSAIPEREKKMFIHFVNTTFNEYIYLNATRAPLWVHFSSSGKVVKNTWLAHATKEDGFYGIQNTGFSIGVDQIEYLGLSTNIFNSSIDKKYGGYNFAVHADHTSAVKQVLKNYGDREHLVLFRASGVELFHYGDNESQVIFLGKTAKDFVFLRWHETDDGFEDRWHIDNISKKSNAHFPAFEEIEDMITWVENNYTQYRKHLVQP